MWPFKRTPIVDAETAAWHADNFAWLIRQFDGSEAFAFGIPPGAIISTAEP